MAENGHIVGIAGAGIAGLTLALALAQRGVKALVLERNDAIQEFGAGLQISANARCALNSLGLEKDLADVSFVPEGIDIFDFKQKSPLTTLQLGQLAYDRFGFPYAVMHRADLAATLHNACQKSANIDIRFGIDTFSVANFGDQQTISFTPHQGEPDICQVRAFVGADGVSSPTRTEVLDGPQADYSGYVAWRALIDIDVAGKFLDLKKTSLMWGPRFHAVSYPLPHRNKVNLALFTKEALSVAFGIRGEPHLPVSVQSDTRLSAIMNAVDNWTHWPLASVMTGTWHKGAVGLIGDAAHAMLPFQAQGAAMAIEDAITLAKLLVNVAQPEAAFSQFESKRRSRVERVIETSKKNGNIFHMRRPATFARNLVVKMQGNTGHLDRLSWLYGHDPTA